jgi:hypothetical protein
VAALKLWKTFWRLIAACAIAITADIQGAVPNTISYQGFLADDSETSLNDTFNLLFSIYDVEVGGNALWQENHINVPVNDGRFQVILGTDSSLSNIAFDEPYWLGISVNGGAELTPRIEFTSSAYSLNARAIIDNAVTSAKILDGAIIDADISTSAGISASKISGTAWTSANDGSSSGLDADLLDGIQASAFVGQGQANSVTTDMITNSTILFEDIAQNAADNGQIIKWNGSSWGPADDATGSGVTDHGSLTGLSDDDHTQYLLVSRSDFISKFTGRLDIKESDIQALMNFRDSGDLRLGWIHNRTGNLQLCADDASLFISSDVDIECTNEAGAATAPIYASAFNVSSARAIKTDIRHLTEHDCQKALADISGLRPATYQLKEATIGKTHIGLIAEEVPPELLAPRGDAVELYALVTSLVAAVKALKAEVELQAKTIKELRGQ